MQQALPACDADLDRASQQMLIDAADRLPSDHNRPPTTALNWAGTAATLLNRTLVTASPQATELLRRPAEAEREQPRRELEPEA